MNRNFNSTLSRRGILAIVAATLMAGASSGALQAQEWPDGTVQFVVPARAGGGTDAVGRILANALQEQTGASFVVVNNPGGGGVVAAETVRSAAPDGQTLLFFHTGILAMHHTGALQPNPLEDFTVAAEMAVEGTYALAVAADSPYQTVDDLVQASIAEPNSISLGVQTGGSTHFMAGLLGMDSGAKFRIVDAGSDADKMVQLQGNQIGAALVNTPGTLQYLENDTLRVLATIGGTPDRDPALPDVPSLHELGYESAVYGLDFLVMGPAGMEPAVTEAINTAVAAIVADPKVTEQLETMSFPVSMIPAEEMADRLSRMDQAVATTAETLGLN